MENLWWGRRMEGFTWKKRINVPSESWAKWGKSGTGVLVGKQRQSISELREFLSASFQVLCQGGGKVICWESGKEAGVSRGTQRDVWNSDNREWERATRQMAQRAYVGRTMCCRHLGHLRLTAYFPLLHLDEVERSYYEKYSGMEYWGRGSIWKNLLPH